MASINARTIGARQVTHEGGYASKISPIEELKRSVMACLLWEDGFYESGEDIAKRIFKLTQSIDSIEVLQTMFAAKFESKLRHAPLLMAVALCKQGRLSAEQIAKVITRADEIPEFVSLFWLFNDGKKTLPHVVRDGLALAFEKFDEYQFAKYDRKKDIRLRDVLRLVRPKPKTEELATLWGKIVKGTLETPDTWEVSLSAGKDKKETFTRLLAENKLPDLAFLRNLRNMIGSKITDTLLKNSILSRKFSKILPFQFLTAAKYAPQFVPQLEVALFKALEGIPKIKGQVTVLVDTSGSMTEKISAKSELTRLEVAAGVAILLRELCEDVRFYAFSDKVQILPLYRGFALKDAVFAAPSGGTYMWGAIKAVSEYQPEPSRLTIVITDEQTADNGAITEARSDLLAIVNVATDQRGVGYGKGSLHVSGWSESVVSYIAEYLNEYVSTT